MPICSYLVFPKADARRVVAAALTDLPGCEVIPADNRDDVMVLVTETESAEDESSLHDALQAIDGIQCLVLTFGEVDGTGSVHQIEKAKLTERVL